MEENNVVECEAKEGPCECRGPSLSILQDVQRLYQEKMDLIERRAGANKLQMQVEVLRSWVSDLVSQNTLLARAVEELELEATNRILAERRKHAEKDNKKDRCDKVNELKIMNDTLQKENSHKDREIRRLNKDLLQYEQTIMSLKNELSQGEYRTNPEVSRRDAEVSAALCCNDREPVQPEESVQTLRKINVALSEEAHGLRRACQLLDQQCRNAMARGQFKDDVIREMRRQLRQAKTKLKKESSQHSCKLVDELVSGDHEFPRECESMGSGPAHCDYLPRHDDHSFRLGAGGDDLPLN